MKPSMPTALLVEDEPFPRAQLKEWLATLWPELEIVGEAADGAAGLLAFEQLKPDVAFLDIRLPGLDGLELARHVASRAHVVFVTAFDEHALAAFDEGAADYLLKPLALPRLARCVERLKSKMTEAPADLGGLLRRFDGARSAQPPDWLRFVQAGDGRGLRLVMLADVLFFQSDAKYTRVVTVAGESLIRTSVRELLPRLDPAQFWQVNRGIVVNLAQVDRVDRDVLGRMQVQLKGNGMALPVSQTFQARFKSM
jgi:DNA-binding LytR/AlgR family response regulator